jgi:protoheme IX farnesyltransferase
VRKKLKILSELTKIRITSFVTITAVFGYICFNTELSLNLLNAVLGILLLACGSAVINHIQEHSTDALMERTRNRPIPSNRISVRGASVISIFLIVIGSAILLLNGFVPLILGLLNLFWYNVVYTPLKKISQIAIIPGSLVGAIPPAIGWTSAGGNIFDPQILIISFFFFIWQIPHFWLLLLMLGKDYEQAGFPSLTQVFNSKQLSRITFVWIIATVVTSLLIPFFGIVKNPVIFISLLAAGIWLTWNASKFLKDKEQKMNFRFAFREINIFALLVMLIISLDQILNLL